MTSNDYPLLSICCLGYNHADFLAENLNSILRINYPNIEVIVVDDGSKDNSLELLKTISNTYRHKIKIIAQQNTGNIGKNLNNAFKEAKGEFISFISLDDVFNSFAIESEMDIIINNKSIAFVASSKALSINKYGIVDENQPERLNLANISQPTINDLLELEYSKFGAFYVQGAVFRKSIIDDIQGFDEDMTGDDIILRTKLFNFMLKETHWDFKIIKENNVFYRFHDNNIHKNTPRQIRIVTEYLDKFWPNKPNPPILIDWACYMINTSSFEHSIDTLTLNKRAKSLLSEEKIQQAIKESLKNDSDKSFFKKFIFSKQKVNETGRQIVLFGFIKFTYEKHKKRPKNQKIHYLKY